jgi:hypothetical protein
LTSEAMFEEVSVWARPTPQSAIRYIGFRDLKTGHVWIALANYLSTADGEEIDSEAVFAGGAVVESFLQDMPPAGGDWKPTVLEAIDHFVENNPAN